MNPKLETALKYIENWEIASFFEFLKAEFGYHEMIARLEKKFIYNKTNEDFADQLRTLAHNFFVAYPAENKAYHEALVEKIKNNRNIGTEEILKEKSTEDLDEGALEKFFLQKRVQIELEDQGMKPNSTAHERLLRLALAENGHLFKGTFLCLGKRNQIHTLSHTIVESKFVYFKGKERSNILIMENVRGNVIQQYEKMMVLMRKHIPLGRKRETDEDIYEIPIIAVREFVSNAYVHRSYEPSIASNIQVEFFDDRITIESPGRLPKDLDMNNIRSSIPTNPTLALIFWYHEYMERLATGIVIAQKELTYYGLEPAQIEQLEKPDTVRVTIWRKENKTENKDLAYAYALLEKDKISDFFDWAEQFGKTEILEQLKTDFVLGKTDSQLKERLKLWAKMLVAKA